MRQLFWVKWLFSCIILLQLMVMIKYHHHYHWVYLYNALTNTQVTFSGTNRFAFDSSLFASLVLNIFTDKIRPWLCVKKSHSNLNSCNADLPLIDTVQSELDSTLPAALFSLELASPERLYWVSSSAPFSWKAKYIFAFEHSLTWLWNSTVYCAPSNMIFCHNCSKITNII